MKFLNKLERKFGKYTIKNLPFYVMVLYGICVAMGVLSPVLDKLIYTFSGNQLGISLWYYEYLGLDIPKVLQGQIWRLVTFIFAPEGISDFMDVIFVAIKLYLYYLFGKQLENAWGAFRFNVFIFSGYLFMIIAAFLLHFGFVLFGIPDSWINYIGFNMSWVYQSMFFSFAVIYPNMGFLFMFFIPVTAKWLAIIDAAFIIYDSLDYVRAALSATSAAGVFYALSPLIAIVAAFLNFLIFFFATRNYKKISPKEYRRKTEFKRQRKQNSVTHRCAICGRTPADDPNLTFRYCSRCKGNYEYCNDHLFTHEHVK